MKLFDVGQEAHGVVAAGQFATGFIAFGQVATGVIAIGQVARGVIAIGQVGFGLFFSVGMGAASLGGAVGMLGVAGRNILGGIIPLVPSVGKPRDVPTPVSFDAAAAKGGDWVEVTVVEVDGAPELHDKASGARLPVKLDHRAAGGALALVDRGDRVLARIEPAPVADVPGPGPLTCTRLIHVPLPPYKRKNFPVIAGLQLTAYLVLAIAWWLVVGGPVLDGLSKM